MSHYLITGGCGFIGSHLADRLLADGHRVRVLDNLSTGKRENLSAAAELVVGDVADRSAVHAALAGVDGCFHLAAVASVERCNRDWLGCHQTNLTGTITVLDCARPGEASAAAIPVVYASSAAVYGDQPAGAISEDAQTRPLSAYGADKLGCELHARAATVVHGVPATGLRFFNVFGPRQDPQSPYSGVISIFCARLQTALHASPQREPQPLPIFGDGQQLRDFIYVSDVVAALVAAMQRRLPAGSVLNVCTGRPVSIVELANAIAELQGCALLLRHLPARLGDIRSSLGNPQRAAAELDFRALVSLADGLKKTLAAAVVGSD